MHSRLWSLGTFLVALGVAAYVVGWDTLLWLPRVAWDSLAWLPATVIDLIRSSPVTFGVIALGVMLMAAARVIGGRRP
ncbi:hypothetical protein LPC08_22480 [Roseomonas sp. OT10]|uniref:hypothetical protein n=1 Tax=Roseomonas cutis TaxID=2897332 RepID=UPI001E495394|nr:hypothetical protein [Roseomonas sp. OT10]UFN48741.1 hypothetical protein LPC08_22480 [Roseomonas sp. OT10]